MENFLRQFVGKKIDVTCGSAVTFRGSVVEVQNGILQLRDEDNNTAYVVIDKIAIVCEVKDHLPRPGFVG